MTGPDEHFGRLLEVLLPAGGHVAMLAEVYVDESGTGKNEPYLALGGYIFTADKARDMVAPWRAMLQEFGIEYFRMSECAHGNKQFKDIPLPRRIACEMRAIELTRSYSECGFGVVISRRDYEEVVPVEYRGIIGSPYTFSLRLCLTNARYWAEQKSGYEGRFAYFFESGCADQSEANRVMCESYQTKPERFRFESHTFADKRTVLPLQAADLLAWQWYTHAKRDPAKAPRKDMVALNRDGIDQVHLMTRERLAGLVRDAGARRRERAANETF